MTDSPAQSAIQLLNQYGIEDPTEVPIEDLIWAQGCLYEQKPMTGAEGRIIFNGEKSAIIVVNQSIQNNQKLRFVRAHELGHLRLHRSLSPFFHCNTKVFLERNKQGSHESEANAFASELLMPRHLFTPLVQRQPFSVKLLQGLAEQFQTSLTATAFRYMELGTEPIAVFFSRNGLIEWAHRSDDYLATYLPIQKPIPPLSLTNRYLMKESVSFGPEMVTAGVWFNDRRVPRELLCYEYCVPVHSAKGALSFVWMSNQYQ